MRLFEDKLYLCKCCNKEKGEKDFSPHPQCKLGIDTSRCKACKKSRWDWSQVPLEKRIYHRVKARAKKKGVEFNIELEDIVIPEECPVFRVSFVYGDHLWTPSLDRLDNAKGYIKGNIQIISNKANMMKSSASLEELERLVEWLKEPCEIV